MCMGWWSIPRFTMRTRTRSPSFTSIGVVAGPDLPLIVSQLNSIASEFGMVLFGTIDLRRVRPAWMDDEQADQAHHFLHGHVRVVEEGPVLSQRELVHKAAARR